MKISNIFQFFFNLFNFKKSERIEPETLIEFIDSNHEINISNRYSLTISPIHKERNNFFLNDDDSCCVCLNSLNSKNIVRMSKCLHKLHISCAKEWLSEKSECPLCRSNQNRLKIRLGI
jgi:hypothetical protein